MLRDDASPWRRGRDLDVLGTLRGRRGAGSQADIRRRANAARDGSRWEEASTLYREYLAAEPGDGAMWVQLGHSLKEQSRFDEAEAAYRRGVSLRPDDADPLLHLSHLLKRAGKPAEAAAAFQQLFKLLPTQEVIEELNSLGYRAEAASLVATTGPHGTTSGCFLELEDVLYYLEKHATVTGISRVVLNLANYVLREMPGPEAERIQFVYHRPESSQLFLVPKPFVIRIVDLVLSDTPDKDAFTALAIEARRKSRPISLGAGDLYLLPGAFWMAAENTSFLPALRREGVRIGAYLYDLIPITHAVYCEVGLTETFTITFAEATRSFDFVLTISAYVAEQVDAFMAKHKLPKLRAIPVPLAHELGYVPSQSGRAPGGQDATQGYEVLDGREFVLCVCTIEARKNHAYLFNIWRLLIEEGIAVPDLVFVGRVGWRVTDFLNQLDASRYLDGKLHVLHDVPDTVLSALYERCLFTAFPSYVEGWGLPVGESLAHGKVCVASSASSIPEVGGGLTLYVDPFNLASGYEIIRRLVTDRAYLAEREKLIRTAFVARTWTDVGRKFFAETAKAMAEAPPIEGDGVYVPRLSHGVFLTVQHLQAVLKRKPAYVENPLRLVFSEGWEPLGISGVWMASKTAKLRFRSDYDQGREVAVLVRLSASPWVGQRNTMQVQVLSEDGSGRSIGYSQPLQPNAFYWCRGKGPVGPEGVVTVQITVSGNVIAEKGHMPVAVQLHAIGFYAVDDIPARLDLWEDRLLSGEEERSPLINSAIKSDSGSDSSA